MHSLISSLVLGNDSGTAPLETNYDGQRDDNKWIDSVADFNLNDDLDPKDQTQLRVYERLVAKMGTFRWQGATGLCNKRILSHLKPKYQNIKEFRTDCFCCFLCP